MSSKKAVARLGGLLLIGLSLLLGLLSLNGPSPAQAATGQALILGSSVSGGASSLEATEAAGEGYSTIDVVSDAQWAAMSAADFGAYELVIIGDPTCSDVSPVVAENAEALATAVMGTGGGRTTAGNRVLNGTDPVFHQSQGGAEFTDRAIAFAAAKAGTTNLFVSFSCYGPIDPAGAQTLSDELLARLTIDPTPDWSLNNDPPCGGSVSLISNTDQFSTLSTSDLEGWGCSVHNTFPTFPTDWSPLAIATDTASQPTCGTDVDSNTTECGEAYILIAGSGIVTEAPNLALTPATDQNPVGSSHTVTATVTNPDDSPRSGVEVDFLVTGANSGASGTCGPATCISDASGQVTFTYTGANEGTDTINASITVDGSTQTATASKEWVAVTVDEIGVAVTKAGASTNVQKLRTFDLSSGAQLSEVNVSGLLNGEQLMGVDHRPATGQVIGFARTPREGNNTTRRTYSIDVETGVATPLAVMNNTPGQANTGVDVNPFVDRLRIVGTTDRNLRVNMDTGATTLDGAIKYAAGDPNAGKNADVAGSAYTNSVSPAPASTTLYALDIRNNVLATQAPPNDGVLNTVGSFAGTFTSNAGFDISGASGNAYASLTNGGTSKLYTVDLTTGALTLVGTIGDGAALEGMTVTPGSGPSGN